jgi:DNA-binding CsgD family transcriptional regulator
MAGRVSSPILIGRSTELENLRVALRSVDGRSTTTVIAGEAGVGKTRLVTEFTDLAESSGARVLQGGCVDLGDGALPYAPLVEALRGLVRRSTEDELDAVLGQSRAELARLVPDLAAADERDSALGATESGQGRLFEMLLGLLVRLASERPLCLIVEDLHWSDRSTRDLLGFLVRNLREARVMLVLTYRSDELHRRHPLLPFLAELGRVSHVERIELEPFDRLESAAHLQAIAGQDLNPRLIDSIHARSGGNAFFAEELFAAASGEGAGELPSTLRDVLLARVAELAEPTQEFLRNASAAGRRVDPELVAAAAGLDETALYDALRESVARQVLIPDPTAGVERYAFRHALVQEAVYDDLLPGERSRLHAAFAGILESHPATHASRAEELAYHWFAAHNQPRALEAAVAAGQAAESRYAYPEALVQYERAIELWDHVPDAETRAGCDRVELLATLANVARFIEPARAVSHVRHAIRLVDEEADPIRFGLLHERLGRYAWMAGQGELATASYRTAMRVTPAEPPSVARARAVAGLAQITMLGGRFAESYPLADEALALARAVGARDIEGHALNTRAMDRSQAGEIEAALADMREALRIAEEAGGVDDIGRAIANETWIYDGAGRLEEALERTTESLARAGRLGLMRFFGTHALCAASDCLYRLGRWDESERAARSAGEIGPLGINRILVEELLARVAVARGRFEEAAERLSPLTPLAERAVDIQFVVPVLASLAELALWEGRPADAAQIAARLRAIDFTPEVKLGELYALGLRANADAAELARARRTDLLEREAIAAGDDLLEALRERHAEVTRDRPVFERQSTAWLLLCEAEWTRLHRTPDPVAWSTCAGAWDDLGRPYVVAYARWREAEARLAAKGDRDEAAGALRAALETAERLGAEPLAGQIRSLAARARLDLGPAKDGAVAEPSPAGAATLDFGLTGREREVLVLVALGRTNRQIAEALFISGNTAGVHVSNILGKLGVAGRGEAAALAYRLGLVEAAS